MVKLICAGYPKTGTKSLTKALHILGYTNIHDYLEHVDYHMEDYERLFAGKCTIDEVLDGYEEHDVDCTVDMPPSFFFEEFRQRWPKAKVILTIREETSWFKSIKKMNESTYRDYHWMSFFSKTAARFETFSLTLYQHMFGSGFENPWLWKMHYRRHNQYVKQKIPDEDLLVFDVKEGWAPLCKFLGKPIPDEEFPFVNAAGSKGNIVEKLIYETETLKTAKRQIVTSIVSASLLTIGITVYIKYVSKTKFGFSNWRISTPGLWSWSSEPEPRS